ncbi:N-acetylmuramoyl-L-alanine amidase [Gandjariella thermophila]|uniref:Peptidoglycan recognition protein family domain-containing protein n=1 Tax=Gandjariella thermophila TaxID=1931992 RepID=A0A4D4JFU0_9PSEU|nr:N-acetylmuramoyl-L-alanine amidase [Gandjariella thermophila]GDY33266.1 hypothetical protein GTS_48990 [Gandjariella thermophila]
MTRGGLRRPPFFTAGLVAVAGALLATSVAANVTKDAPRTVEAGPIRAAALPNSAPVKPRAETIPLATAQRPDGAGPEVREAVPRNEFSMVGFTWPGKQPDSLEVRTRSAQGAWSPWRSVGAIDSGPDGRAAPKLSEPVWVGPATRLQARALRGGRPAVTELSAVTIDPGRSANDARIGLKAFSGVPTMPTVITRAQWGADESLMTWDPEYATTVKAVPIHHTANSNDYTCDQSASIVRGIYYYHAVTNGWGDIGYNALVDKCGNIFEGRFGGLNLPIIGAHTAGFNRYTFGISMIGDYNVVAPSPQTLDAVTQMAAWKLSNSYDDAAGTVTLTSAGGNTSKYAVGTAVTLPTIFGHRDTNNTECPGSYGYAALDQIRNQAVQLAGDWRTGDIYQKWQSLGGEAAMGPAYSVETDWPGGGRATDFGSGASTIAWRGDLGAHAIGGAIHADFVQNGGQPALGYPTTDELGTPDGVGRYNHFTKPASIYWTPDTGAHAIYGAIRDRWAALGWETGRLGYPTTDESGTPDGIGRYNHFTKNASIYWTPDTGAHAIYGAIRDRWAALGWETGPLGYPTTDESGTPDGIGRYNHFTKNASIYWTPDTGAHGVYGAIRARWASLGWETSWLGYPTSDEYDVTGGRRSDFQGGYITWDASTGVATAYGY